MKKIRFALRLNDYKLRMMFLTKSSLLEQLRIDFSFKNIPSASFAKPLTIDFSSLKSLGKLIYFSIKIVSSHLQLVNFEAIKLFSY